MAPLLPPGCCSTHCFNCRSNLGFQALYPSSFPTAGEVQHSIMHSARKAHTTGHLRGMREPMDGEHRAQTCSGGRWGGPGMQCIGGKTVTEMHSVHLGGRAWSALGTTGTSRACGMQPWGSTALTDETSASKAYEACNL